MSTVSNSATRSTRPGSHAEPGAPSIGEGPPSTSLCSDVQQDGKPITTCGTHELSRGECLDLLGRSSLGRLAFVDSVGILPIIVPVNYVMHEGSVVFRAGPGAKLAAAVRGAAVAFEVGRTDETDQTGWTVLVRGIAEELVDATVLTELREQHLRPWAPGTKRHYVRIDAHLVTGRRIDRNDAASPMWDPTM